MYGQDQSAGFNQGQAAGPVIAAHATSEERRAFLVRTYAHLFGAIIAFVGIMGVIQISGFADKLTELMLSGGQLGWLVVLGLFVAVSYGAEKLAHSNTSPGMQYAGLGLYTVAEAVIFTPLITLALVMTGGQELLLEAGLVTVGLFGALTAIVLVTGKDFSFLRGALMFGGIAAIGLIIMGSIVGFTLGPIFMWAMVFLAGLSTLYNTSNALHHYPTNMHVAAALSLFASFALMLWYVIQLFMSRD